MDKELLPTATIKSEAISIGGSTYQVLVVDQNGPGPGKQSPVILVEPFTWAWVAIKICEGIISYIGAKIFSQLIGDTGLTKKDFVGSAQTA